MPNQTEPWQVSRRVSINIVARRSIVGGVIAKTKRDIRSGGGVFEGGRYTYGEDGGIVGQGATGGEVIHEPDRGAGERLGTVSIGGYCGEDGGEGGDGGKVKDTASLDSGFMDRGDAERRGEMGWRVGEEMLGWGGGTGGGQRDQEERDGVWKMHADRSAVQFRLPRSLIPGFIVDSRLSDLNMLQECC